MDPDDCADGDDDSGGFGKGALYKRKDFLGIEEEGTQISKWFYYCTGAMVPSTQTCDLLLPQPSFTPAAHTITASPWTWIKSLSSAIER